jgi:hypothetical protein
MNPFLQELKDKLIAHNKAMNLVLESVQTNAVISRFGRQANI